MSTTAVNTGPPKGSAWRSLFRGEPRPLDAKHIRLLARYESVGWARYHARIFLNEIREISSGAIENAELLVCELFTNAVIHPGKGISGIVNNTSLITLSLRHFPESLLIEVHDSSDSPPISRFTDTDVEFGRGLMIVNALCKEWSYFYTADGKVVWCLLETAT
jgi:anti-sigma regulatory factor (Ser/Thr protein kinase)